MQKYPTLYPSAESSTKLGLFLSVASRAMGLLSTRCRAEADVAAAVEEAARPPDARLGASHLQISVGTLKLLAYSSQGPKYGVV